MDKIMGSYLELYSKIEKLEDIDDVKNVLFNIAERMDCLERVIIAHEQKMTRLGKDSSVNIKIQKE